MKQRSKSISLNGRRRSGEFVARGMSAAPSARHTPRNKPRGKHATSDQDSICAKAATYCLMHFPTLWTVGTARKTATDKHSWIITVVLRYPTGHEGELGELLFDGKNFTPLTARPLMDERARKIAADPALKRAWNEYRGPSVPPRKP